MSQHNPMENNLLENLDYEKEEQLFYEVNILNEREFSTFIKKTEALCRKSQEYSVWSSRTKMKAKDQNSDYSKDDSSNCPICEISYEYAQAESHHHPITLFNLCVKQFQEWIDENVLEEKTALDLVQEVMADHLINRVEHVVVCKHCHEKYHNGEQHVKEAIDNIMLFKREQARDNMPDQLKQKYESINAKNSREWEEKHERRRRALVSREILDIDRDSITNDILSMVKQDIKI